MSNLPAIRPDYWLQNAASLAMSSLLARLDLNQAARPYFWIDIRQSPPQASHSYGDDIERIARNQLLENQYRDETTLRQLYPGIDEYAIAGQPYTGWWRGATMVEIQPPGEGYPIYQRRHLVADDLSVPDPALIDVSNQPFSELSLW